MTQGGDGKLWAAWSEGRRIVDSRGSEVIPAGGPTQPHIALVSLDLKAGSQSEITGGSKGFLWNANHAFFLPDLATGASGDVAITYDWGGGTQFLNHAVGFVSGGFTSITVAGSNTDQSTTGMSGDNNLNNPAGDYQTVRALPPPFGDCFVAAGNINHDSSQLVLSEGVQETLPLVLPVTHTGLPVFTMFSRTGASCPKRFFQVPFPLPTLPLEPAQPAPGVTTETLSLTCPLGERRADLCSERFVVAGRRIGPHHTHVRVLGLRHTGGDAQRHHERERCVHGHSAERARGHRDHRREVRGRLDALGRPADVHRPGRSGDHLAGKGTSGRERRRAPGFRRPFWLPFVGSGGRI